MSHHQNLVVGTRVSCTDQSESTNPSGLSDTIGHDARADVRNVDEAVHAARGSRPNLAHAGPHVRTDLSDAVGIAILVQVLSD